MPTCNWCNNVIISCTDHQDILGAYTCVRAKGNEIVDKPLINNSLYSQKKRELRELRELTRLFHQTSKDRAELILKNGFRIGPWGMAGPGIYFAERSEDTWHKAMNRGVILECWVELGNVLTVSENGDQSLNGTIVKQLGCDSVRIPRSRGTEFVVYYANQIHKISIYEIIATH
jgi:hypothetical protein